MGPGFFMGQGMGWGGFATLAPFFLLLMVWSLLWKGLALWHSARRNQNWWFIIFLFINTAGILEIVYLFAVLKIKFNELFHKDASPTTPPQM